MRTFFLNWSPIFFRDSQMCLRCAQMFSDVHRCVQMITDVFWIFSWYSIDVILMFSRCFLDVPRMFAGFFQDDIRWSPVIRWSPAIRSSIGGMDFDDPKVYGDTSISNGLVKITLNGHQPVDLLTQKGVKLLKLLDLSWNLKLKSF